MPGSWPRSRISPRASGRSRTCRSGSPASRTSGASARRSWPRPGRSSATTPSASTASTTTPAGASRSRSRASSWAADDPSRAAPRPIGEGLTGWVAEHGEPLLLGDAHADPRSLIVGETTGPESMLVVPMTYEGRVRGVVVASRPGPGPLRAGRRDDASDLRRHGRPGPRQRRAPGAAPEAAGGAGAPARQPAPAHGGQRAAPLDPRPVGRPRDDRRLAEVRRHLRLADDLPDRQASVASGARHRPRPVRGAHPRLRRAARHRPHRLGGRPPRAGPRQRRPPRTRGRSRSRARRSSRSRWSSSRSWPRARSWAR